MAVGAVAAPLVSAVFSAGSCAAVAASVSVAVTPSAPALHLSFFPLPLAGSSAAGSWIAWAVLAATTALCFALGRLVGHRASALLEQLVLLVVAVLIGSRHVPLSPHLALAITGAATGAAASALHGARLMLKESWLPRRGAVEMAAGAVLLGWCGGFRLIEGAMALSSDLDQLTDGMLAAASGRQHLQFSHGQQRSLAVDLSDPRATVERLERLGRWIPPLLEQRLAAAACLALLVSCFVGVSLILFGGAEYAAVAASASGGQSDYESDSMSEADDIALDDPEAGVYPALDQVETPRSSGGPRGKGEFTPLVAARGALTPLATVGRFSTPGSDPPAAAPPAAGADVKVGASVSVASSRPVLQTLRMPEAGEDSAAGGCTHLPRCCAALCCPSLGHGSIYRQMVGTVAAAVGIQVVRQCLLAEAVVRAPRTYPAPQAGAGQLNAAFTGAALVALVLLLVGLSSQVRSRVLAAAGAVVAASTLLADRKLLGEAAHFAALAGLCAHLAGHVQLVAWLALPLASVPLPALLPSPAVGGVVLAALGATVLLVLAVGPQGLNLLTARGLVRGG